MRPLSLHLRTDSGERLGRLGRLVGAAQRDVEPVRGADAVVVIHGILHGVSECRRRRSKLETKIMSETQVVPKLRILRVERGGVGGILDGAIELPKRNLAVPAINVCGLKLHHDVHVLGIGGKRLLRGRDSALRIRGRIELPAQRGGDFRLLAGGRGRALRKKCVGKYYGFCDPEHGHDDHGECTNNRPDGLLHDGPPGRLPRASITALCDGGSLLQRRRPCAKNLSASTSPWRIRRTCSSLRSATIFFGRRHNVELRVAGRNVEPRGRFTKHAPRRFKVGKRCSRASGRARPAARWRPPASPIAARRADPRDW